MTTYGEFYNPKQQNNPYKAIIVIFFAVLMAILLFSCNTVKRTTDLKINRYDSSFAFKVDSTAVLNNNYTIGTHNKKEWDKETTIDFWQWPYGNSMRFAIGGHAGIDTLNNSYADQMIKHLPYVIIEDGVIKVVDKPIKSITTRSKGKDSSTSKIIDRSQSDVNVKKEGSTDVKSFEKEKSKSKDSKRAASPILIAIGLLATVVLVIFMVYKLRK